MQRSDDPESALQVVGRKRSDAIFVTPDAYLFLHRKRIADFATENRLATFFPWREAVEDGGLASYGPDMRDLLRRAATYVDLILKGANPGELPIQQPTKFELIINLKTAKTLGLTIPPSLLARADEVIE